MQTDYRKVLEQTLSHAIEYLDGLNGRSVAATASLAELRERFALPLSDDGMAPTRVMEELVASADGGLTGSGGGRFFAWVIGGATPASLAADWMTSVWDQNAGLYACSPAASVIEEVAGGWLKELLGIPASASFAFTTGCQSAHNTCLAAARNGLLARAGWDVEERGLAGSPPISVFAGNRHGTIDRALRFLGVGVGSLRELEMDAEGRLRPDALSAALSENRGRPAIVTLQAGDINTGSYDRFEELIPIAHEFGAWVHVDGAFGQWANASPRHRHFLAGAELADSWATDGHKWLNVPYDSGYAFVADTEAHRRSMSHRASYLLHADEARDQMDWNLEWSRRGRGIATYAAIRELGTSGIADLVDRCCRYASDLVDRIGSLEGAEVVLPARINQGLVRFLDPDGSSHDARTDAVIERIVRSGEAFFGGTNWNGMRCMRISVSGWQTSDSDIDRTVDAVRDAIRK